MISDYLLQQGGEDLIVLQGRAQLAILNKNAYHAGP
jgi:hypothetical protein